MNIITKAIAENDIPALIGIGIWVCILVLVVGTMGALIYKEFTKKEGD